MRSLSLIVVLSIIVSGCGMIEDSVNIPEPGTYVSANSRVGYVSKLVIAQRDKGYDITFVEVNTDPTISECQIDASGKKSSYGIWVEIPAYGARLPVIIRKKEEVIDVSLKGTDNPKETFQYCLRGRTPAGVYRKANH